MFAVSLEAELEPLGLDVAMQNLARELDNQETNFGPLLERL